MPPIVDPGAPPRSSPTPPPALCHVGRLPGPSSQIRGRTLGQGPLPSRRSPPSSPAASPLCGSNRPREGAAAWGRELSPVRPTSAGSRGPRTAPSPGAAALPAVRAVWPRLGPLLSALELYKILITKKARKKKESLHSPTPKSIFQGGGAEGSVSRTSQTSERGQRGVWPGQGPRARDRGRAPRGAQAGGAGSPPAGGGGAAAALFDVESPAHPGAGIRGAPMSSNVRKFEEG